MFKNNKRAKISAVVVSLNFQNLTKHNQDKSGSWEA